LGPPPRHRASPPGSRSIPAAEARTAIFTVTTKDDTAKVLDYYESQLKSAGIAATKSSYNTNGQTGGSVTGKSADGKREASVAVSTDAEGTHALISFTEKK